MNLYQADALTRNAVRERERKFIEATIKNPPARTGQPLSQHFSHWSRLMIKIDKGIPLPPETNVGGGAKYPFRDMEVGDSFFVPIGESKIKATLAYYRKTLKGRTFISRTERKDGEAVGTRVWRSK